jgi:hypothetical protein
MLDQSFQQLIVGDRELQKGLLDSVYPIIMVFRGYKGRGEGLVSCLWIPVPAYLKH